MAISCLECCTSSGHPVVRHGCREARLLSSKRASGEAYKLSANPAVWPAWCVFGSFGLEIKAQDSYAEDVPSQH